MAKIIQIPYDNHITLPVTTAQAVQKTRVYEQAITLEALGLLTNLLSYPSTWELHKMELYKRFEQNGRTSVNSAWNSLVKANYIIEFRYRVGKKYEYVYYLRKVPFTAEEKAQILENAKKEYGEIFGLSILRTPKRVVNKKNILNKKNLNNNIIIDEDIAESANAAPSEPTKEDINSIIDRLREETKDDLREASFNAVVRKVLSKFNNGEIKNFENYLNTAIIRKIEELEARREKARIVNELKKQGKSAPTPKPIPTDKVVEFDWTD